MVLSTFAKAIPVKKKKRLRKQFGLAPRNGSEWAGGRRRVTRGLVKALSWGIFFASLRSHTTERNKTGRVISFGPTYAQRNVARV